MEIPVALLSYNRPEYLSAALAEQRRTKTEFPIHVFDDGSDDEEQKTILSKVEEEVTVHRFEHKGYKAQFFAIMQYFKDSGYRYYTFIEDDAVFSINWHGFCIDTILMLEHKGFDVGALASYTGHPVLVEQVFPHVFRHTFEPFYGTCAVTINTKISDEYDYYAHKKGWNPDIALREMSLNKSRDELFVIAPTLAEHIGAGDSKLNAPAHRSGRFLGRDKDVYTEWTL